MTIILNDGQLMTKVMQDIQAERDRQIAKWGIQHRPNVVDMSEYRQRKVNETVAKALCDYAERHGNQPPFTGGASWEHIINEELAEAMTSFCEPDKAARRKELVQCAAVIVAWIEDLDSH